MFDRRGTALCCCDIDIVVQVICKVVRKDYITNASHKCYFHWW